MEWTTKAEEAIKKVPFFVRKKVRARVEKEALADNKHEVTIKEVKLTQKRFLTNMSAEIKGYQLDNCFGVNGCPHRAVQSETLVKRLEALLQNADILEFLQKNVKGSLKFHHEFRVTVAECPNSCSQPQIKDVGIIGGSIPEITDEDCSMCGGCVDVCREDAVTLLEDKEVPQIDFPACLKCGKCADVCPTGTIKKGNDGYRVLLGGKLGRHPRLAAELDGIFSEDEVLVIVEKCIVYYKANSTGGKRFAELVYDKDPEKMRALLNSQFTNSAQ